MSATKSFHLGDILTVTTGGILVSPRYMDGASDILRFLTGEDVFTHQIGRVARECQEPLLAQHPDLRDVTVPGELSGEAAVMAWLAGQVSIYGEYREVAPLAAEDHTSINPLDEWRMVAPDVEQVVVVLPDEEPQS